MFLFWILACTHKVKEISTVRTELAPVDYKILDWRTVKQCNSYAFGIRLPLFEGRKYGFTSSSLLRLTDIREHETKVAMYKILDKSGSAATLAFPRYETKVSGISIFGTPVFGERCSTVKARPVIVKDGPYQISEKIEKEEE